MKKEEYLTLKEEINDLTMMQNNCVIAMYTITIAILSLAIQQKNEWLFLLPYIILFSFQRIINAKKDVRIRAIAYIAVFLDGENGFEKNYATIVEKTTGNYNNKKFDKVMNVISGRVSSLQLGVVCTIGATVMCIFNKYSEWKTYTNVMNDLAVVDILPIILGIFLLGILKEWCTDALDSMKKRERYIQSLEAYKREMEKSK